MANCGFYLWRLNERASVGSCPQLRHPTSGFIWFPSPLAFYIVRCLRQLLSTGSAPQFQLSQAFQSSRRGIKYPAPHSHSYSLNTCSGFSYHFITMCECYAVLENKTQIGNCSREGPGQGCKRDGRGQFFSVCVWR